MARKIAEGVGDVHVQDPKTGAFVILHEGDDVPSDYDKLVGDHATTGRRSARSQVAAGPGQTPEVVARAKAAQEAADANADKSGDADGDAPAPDPAEAEKAAEAEAASKAQADADALAKAEAAEKAKAAAAAKAKS